MRTSNRNKSVIGWLFLVVVLWNINSGRVCGQQSLPVSVRLEKGPPGTTISLHPVEPFKVRLDVIPGHGEGSVVIYIELARRGRGYWLPEFVIVTDQQGRPIPVRHPALEWYRMWITVPAKKASYYPQAVRPKMGHFRPRYPRENERTVQDAASGFKASICTWYDGRRAALSLRFDDSHPTHLSKVIPYLRQYGFKGTFMINPGNSDYLEHKTEWEIVARQGDMEFANHTMHHRGARNDEEMEHEIGDAALYIQSLFPNKSKLIALNLGGGTWWTTTKPLRYYLDKYSLFDAMSGSLSMDDNYGHRVEAFKRHLERNIERGGWCRVHFHSIGKGFSTSEEHFRAILDIVKAHEHKLWIAGVADAYKYLQERRASKLEIVNISQSSVKLKLTCLTDSTLYDQPLTLEVTCPRSWSTEKVRVTDAEGNILPTRRVSTATGVVLRFDVPPVTASYTIRCGE